ncbi:hypothetical protein [Paenibacillus sp. SYP-B4298]|uniref:hypothetical protein n=1 Tax=Paenibacillus sp. SYP-B4298 TaxID=2996034 RepID=UPI0022DD6496|nr:hypothetical protein [Paenibacillus sp. SYP-B4298]
MIIAALLSLKWEEERPEVLATWVWESTDWMDDGGRLLSFAKEQGVNVIFLHIDRTSQDMEPYRRFIEQAHRLGIEVEALGGDPSWGLAAYRQEVEAFLRWIEGYQRSAPEQARWDGVHVDIEPYLLEEWEQERATVVREWRESAAYVAHWVRKELSLRVSADVPSWIHTIDDEQGESLGTWMLEQFDCIVLMNYRNAALGHNGIMDRALPMVQEGTRLGKPVLIGLETGPTDEGAHTTFYGQDSSSLWQQMSITHLFMQWYSGYQGFSIHDYRNWRAAAEGRE